MQTTAENLLSEHLDLNQWKSKIKDQHPTAKFTLEDGSGKSNGDIGDWTAHLGSDMSSDVVGTFCPGNNFCSVLNQEGEFDEYVQS